ncbi:MAG: hypothetical protein JNL07_11560, partial [Rhodospirillales bacterium]|nr:hypothetical protein [Rhodospirillales bacterium]
MVATAVAVPVLVGGRDGIVLGLLSDTDAYTRVNRIIASVEAGRVLDHVPRDNSGDAVPLHWTHLLDALIMAIALPLRAYMDWSEATRLAGAAIGPLSTLVVALAAVGALRAILPGAGAILATGALAALGPHVLDYGAFGRADHHVLHGAVALAAPALAYAATRLDAGARLAIAGGAVGGLGVWLSPEPLPFILFGWALTLLSDTRPVDRTRLRALSFAGGDLGAVALGWVVDPPSGGRFATEIDRLSWPYVELGLLMVAASAAAPRATRRFGGAWPAAIVAGAVAAAALALWLAHYPA